MFSTACVGGRGVGEQQQQQQQQNVTCACTDTALPTPVSGLPSVETQHQQQLIT
jgi:hypothetical protein